MGVIFQFIEIPVFVTLAGKNLFGAWNPSVFGMHDYLLYGEAAMGNAAPQADLLLHEDLGGKTLLALGDGTWGCRHYNYNIERFQMYPFNDDWPSSLFFSQDTVALDSVMYDFLWVEQNGYPSEGAQNYLHEVADPPIGRYDPEGDGTYVSDSLGVHEHCDPDVDIFSSDRYSGPSGNGIDYICDNVYNRPPESPSDPDPSDGATNVDINADLSWSCSDPDGDSLTYDVYFGTVNPPVDKVSDDQAETTFDPGTLEAEPAYYWQIIAKDVQGAFTFGPVWLFSTEENNPPNAPLIDGQSYGKIRVEYDYTFNTTDPEGHDVHYWIEWGDGTVEQDDWIGPYSSSEKVKLSHSWSQKKTFIIKAKAKDIFDAESDFTELSVTISRTKVFKFSNYLLELFFEILLNAFPLPKYLIVL